MLSSIHPLGERARHNRWSLTAAAFTLGAVIAGASIGTVLASAGSLILNAGSDLALALTAAAALGAGLADLAGIRPPGPARQVNENWIGAFRGWVYGGGFGVQLGVGFLTYVVTWVLYATLAAELLTADPRGGALVGTVFALGRSIALWMAGTVDRPSRLTRFSRRMARTGPLVRRSTSMLSAGMGLLVLIGGAL